MLASLWELRAIRKANSLFNALVVELADTLDQGSSAVRLESPSLSEGTYFYNFNSLKEYAKIDI